MIYGSQNDETTLKTCMEHFPRFEFHILCLVFKRAFFKLNISSYLNFWMKKTFFGAFKLIETSDLVEILSHFFFQKVRGQSFPNLFSKKLYDQKNKIYQTLKSSKKSKIIQDSPDFFSDLVTFFGNQHFFSKKSFSCSLLNEATEASF